MKKIIIFYLLIFFSAGVLLLIETKGKKNAIIILSNTEDQIRKDASDFFKKENVSNHFATPRQSGNSIKNEKPPVLPVNP